MVGGDNAFAVELEQFRNYFGATLIDRFDGFDSRFDNAGVADHVGIGKVQDDQIEFVDPLEELIGHFKRAHFRLKIVSRDFRRRNEEAFLAGKWFLDATVKKICDVRIFFSFRDADLFFARLADELAENDFQIRRRKNKWGRKPNVVLGE